MSRASLAEAGLALTLATVALAFAAGRLTTPAPLHHPGPTLALLHALDHNGSGTLEGDELSGHDPPGQPWPHLDLDGSGRLDARELEVAMTSLDPTWLLSAPP